MDTKQLEYIISIANEKSLTRAAQKHAVTKSTLSQHLSRLEEELGTPLFLRGKSEWNLTPEGEIYVEEARQIVHIKERAYARIAENTELHRGFISLGFNAGRGSQMFAEIYPSFYEAFPDIILQPREMGTTRMQEEIRKGGLDLGIMTLCENQKTSDQYIDLTKEKLFLCLPENYRLPPGVDLKEPYPVFPLETLKEEPFVMINKESTGRWAVEEILRKAGFYPRVLFETVNYTTILAMIQAGLCAGFIPEYYVKKKPQHVRFFSVEESPIILQTVCYEKHVKLTVAEKYIIQLARDYFIRSLK